MSKEPARSANQTSPPSRPLPSAHSSIPPTPRLISARDVLSAVIAMQRLGASELLRRLEQSQPDLAEYAMESLSNLHGRLLALGGRAKQTQKVFELMQTIVLV